tara:strand:+ start:580 stop:1335 length:756 start_codon:yes stop_codon:yes gene_type:complete
MIPKKLKPNGLYDLTRIGKNNDGGYLICKNNYDESDCLISFGISNDFSFEKAFKNKTEKKILAFDPTTTNNFFLKDIIFNFLRFKFTSFFLSIINFYNFKKFFSSKNSLFFLKKIGKGGSIKEEYISIDHILDLCKDRKKIFFKIDIEGSEYRILKDLLKNEELISGLVIEFHDVDLHLDKIINFIDQSKLKLIHVHGNNWLDYGQNNIPTCLELTFSKNPTLISEQVDFPHILDQKNNPNVEDIILNFEK